jgi:hypothetical protein
MSDELNNTDMQEFAIQDEMITEESMVDPLETLVNHDFSTEDEINMEESYEMLSVVERENKISKTLEADNVIKELEDIYVDVDYKEKLNKSFENVKSYMRKYSIEKDEIKSLSDEEKTKIFAIGSFLNKNVGYLINELQFSINITREEYKFIATAIEQKLTYDGNEVFNIIQLNEKYLKEWKKIDKSLPNQVPNFIINVDIKNVVMLYHFLGKHTVKGLGKEFYTFASVLQKIADTNRLFNAYNILKERLNVDFSFWTGAMEPEQPIQPMQPENVQGFVPQQ